MLAVSRALNPECEHVEGDMRTVRLGREFDCRLRPRCRLLHDDARPTCGRRSKPRSCTAGRAARRCSRPTTSARTFGRPPITAATTAAIAGLRYLEWTWDPDPADSTYVVDYAYLLRDADGSVRVEQDRHVEGLFSRADWLRLLSDVGFEPDPGPSITRSSNRVRTKCSCVVNHDLGASAASAVILSVSFLITKPQGHEDHEGS